MRTGDFLVGVYVLEMKWNTISAERFCSREVVVDNEAHSGCTPYVLRIAPLVSAQVSLIGYATSAW